MTITIYYFAAIRVCSLENQPFEFPSSNHLQDIYCTSNLLMILLTNHDSNSYNEFGCIHKLFETAMSWEVISPIRI
jgi:hypothetical protein